MREEKRRGRVRRPERSRTEKVDRDREGKGVGVRVGEEDREECQSYSSRGGVQSEGER